MAIRTILLQNEKVESNDVPAKFTNIDKEDFTFQWDGKKKLIKKGQTVTIQKYLVNYAAYHLAKKMVKRDLTEEWKNTPIDQRTGFPNITDERKEYGLQKQMVAKNNSPLVVPEDFKEEEKVETLVGKEEGDKNPITGEPDPDKVEVLDGDDEAAEVPEEPVGPQEEAPISEGFKCEQCDFIAKSEAGLKSHMRMHK